ncbi:unnamed protein product [Orchesella dallaii]|uniref:C-type lectin domain-containing protein n=1 Tax=Orchesella dallaii TaxID=48710 RepID=A0ABP1PIR4_9HEXA
MRVLTSFLFFYCVLFEDPAVGAQGNEELIPQGLKVLGTVGEKTYLVDTDGVLRNWTESKSFCQNRGLTLATITTHNQAEFLKNSYDPTQFNGWYWVNAREGDNGNLSWEATHKPVQEFDTLSTMEAVSQITKSRLIELGSADGKIYFGDHILRNWNDSYEFCKRQELQLATVSTEAERGFLKATSTKINYDGWFWIANSQREKSEEEDNRCLCFSSLSSRSFKRRCTYQHFTLCEIRSSKSSNLAISANQNDKNPDLEVNAVSESRSSGILTDKPVSDDGAAKIPRVTSSSEHSLLYKSILEQLHRELQEYVEKEPNDTALPKQELL